MKFPTQPPNKHLLPHVIAVIGCDGSGKSTLTGDLFEYLNRNQLVELIYLGQSSGNIVDWIKGLPFIGPAIGRYLVNKAKRVHHKKSSSPDNLTAIVIYLLSRWRVHKFRKMLKHSRGSKVVITDRYPQAEVQGFYFDGTGLDPQKANTWLTRKLAASEQRLYQWMASHVPSLVIRLNIDAATAHERKPDHKMAMLEKKTSVIPCLTFNAANILDLDSRTPYPQVFDTALSATKAIIANNSNNQPN